MPEKTKMIETFLSVLKNKKSLRGILKKYYEFYLLKKANFSKTIYVDPKKLVLGVKMHFFFRNFKINSSQLLQSSSYISFLKDIDRGKNYKDTNHYKLMKLYGGKKFANRKTKSFMDMYKKMKKAQVFKPIHVYANIADWRGNFPDFPKKVILKVSKDKYVIFDGHHRAAIMTHLKFKKIPAKLIKSDFIANIMNR